MENQPVCAPQPSLATPPAFPIVFPPPSSSAFSKYGSAVLTSSTSTSSSSSVTNLYSSLSVLSPTNELIGTAFSLCSRYALGEFCVNPYIDDHDLRQVVPEPE